jgi:hypothetical protein
MNKNLIIIIFILAVVFVSGCAAPEEINKRIAETYGRLNSLSYDVQVIRTDTYEKQYTAYEITQVQTGTREATDIETGEITEVPIFETVVGDSYTLTGSRFVWDSSIFIQKPDKKTIISSGSYDPYISGGQQIKEKWQFRYEPAGTVEEKKQVCNGNTIYLIPDRGRGADVSVDSTNPNKCQESVQNSIWQIPASLDDPSKFKVDITKEEGVIRANIESATGDFFYIENIEFMPFHKIVLWFDLDDLKLIKFEGALAKSKKGTETGIGLSTIYTMTFKNVVFNPAIPSRTFDVDLNKYEKVVDIKILSK